MVSVDRLMVRTAFYRLCRAVRSGVDPLELAVANRLAGVSRSLGPDGKIMPADIMIGDSHIMLNDAMMGMKGPKGFGGIADRAGFSWWIASRREDLKPEEIRQRAEAAFQKMSATAAT